MSKKAPNSLHELLDEVFFKGFEEGFEEGYENGKEDWYKKGYHQGRLEMVEKLGSAASDSCRDGHSSGGRGLNVIKKVKQESKNM